MYSHAASGSDDHQTAIWIILAVILAAGIAAVLIQRFFTAYLPPVWGWFTLAWMRRRDTYEHPRSGTRKAGGRAGWIH